MIEIDTHAFRDLCGEVLGVPWAEFPASVSNDARLARALTRWLASLQGELAAVERESAAVFLGLLCVSHAEPRHDSSAHDLARRVRARLLDHGLVVDGIGEIAEQLGVSRYRLIRAFKRAYGLTPEDFRRQLRVERARDLLARSEPLAAIAADAGFADQSHMTREFTRLLGLTPGAYRRVLR
jgi:AraC-like DNA-binding protein